MTAQNRHLQVLGGPTQTRGGGGAVEDDKGGLEGDVAKDGEADVGIGLDAAEAGGARGIGGRVVDVLAGDGDLGITRGEGEVGELGVAGEDVAALLLVATAVATYGTSVSNVIKEGSVPPNSRPSTRQKIEYEPWPPL